MGLSNWASKDWGWTRVPACQTSRKAACQTFRKAAHPLPGMVMVALKGLVQRLRCGEKAVHETRGRMHGCQHTCRTLSA